MKVKVIECKILCAYCVCVDNQEKIRDCPNTWLHPGGMGGGVMYFFRIGKGCAVKQKRKRGKNKEHNSTES